MTLTVEITIGGETITKVFSAQHMWHIELDPARDLLEEMLGEGEVNSHIFFYTMGHGGMVMVDPNKPLDFAAFIDLGTTTEDRFLADMKVILGAAYIPPSEGNRPFTRSQQEMLLQADTFASFV